jgi:hypothetical protein
MDSASAMNVHIAHAQPWRDAGNYAFVSALQPAGCPWKFLRRNPDYQKACCSFSSPTDLLSEENCGAAVWGLARFEPPEHERGEMDDGGARAAAARSRLNGRRTVLS